MATRMKQRGSKTVEPFVPTAAQLPLWETIAAADPGSYSIIGYGGAVGGGKTRALAELAIDLSLAWPGTQILVGRKDYKDLKTTTLREFDRVVPPQLLHEVNKTDHWRSLRLGDWEEGVASVVRFEELKDYHSLGSEEFSWVLVEEAGEVPEASVLMLISRLRDQYAGKFGLIAASNPWPGWFERWFIEKQLPEEVFEEFGGKVSFFPARISDNPHIKPSPEKYQKMLEGIYGEEWTARMVQGKFGTFEGQVYKKLGPSHEYYGTLPRFERLVGGIDIGGANDQANKSAGVVGGIVAGNQRIARNSLIRFAHFADAGDTVHYDLVDWMSSVEKMHGRRVVWRVAKEQALGISMLKKAGFIVTVSEGKNEGNVALGIDLVNQRFANGTSFFTPDLREKPSQNADSWYDYMTKYRWQQQPDENRQVPGVPIKRNDDTCDADRYMHEEADGLPTYMGPAVRSASRPGMTRRAKYAV